MAKRAKIAWVEHLTFLAPWTWFVGLTFARDLSAKRADDAFNAWLKKLAKEFGCHLPYGVSWGPQASGRPHYHAVVFVPSNGGPPASPETAERTWRKLRDPTGTALAAPYDGGRRGLDYMVHGHQETSCGVACPQTGPCAHDGCKKGPGGRF